MKLGAAFSYYLDRGQVPTLSPWVATLCHHGLTGSECIGLEPRTGIVLPSQCHGNGVSKQLSLAAHIRQPHGALLGQA